ncbi:MAG: hypothetical protein D3923_16155, partial [Candidatus Electrothrix sp. AR3]|nr:hypothetical protein [Candidatus Electrothrix sp. AR3]
EPEGILDAPDTEELEDGFLAVALEENSAALSTPSIEIDADKAAEIDEKLDSLFDFDGYDGRPKNIEESQSIIIDNTFDLDEEFEVKQDDNESFSNKLASSDDASAENEFFLGQEYEVDSQEASAPEAEPVDSSDETDLIGSLLAATRAFTSTPSSENLSYATRLVGKAREGSISTNQSVILNLLNSSIRFLTKAPGNIVLSNTITQELAAGLERAEEPGGLIEVIEIYTAWQQDCFEKICSGSEKNTAQYEESSSQVFHLQEEVSSLKETMKKEFSMLRKELHDRS